MVREWTSACAFSRLATAAVLVISLDAINPRYPAVADQMAQVREKLAAGIGMGS